MLESRYSNFAALRLGALYTRLSSSPWRKTILFIGSPATYPSNHQTKCFVHAVFDGQVVAAHHVQLQDEALPFAPHSFDMVILDLSSVAKKHHTPLLQEVYRVLAMHGKLLLSFHNWCSPYYFFRLRTPSLSQSYVQRLIKRHHFHQLQSFAHSYRMDCMSSCVDKFLLKKEKTLKRYFKSCANHITFLLVKEQEQYQPLPSYLRLSKKILVPSFS